MFNCGTYGKIARRGDSRRGRVEGKKNKEGGKGNA